jgi:hypothetical protein
LKIQYNQELFDWNIIAVSSDVTWGSITGTLSNQTDLQTALNAKQDTLVLGTNIKTVGGISFAWKWRYT